MKDGAGGGEKKIQNVIFVFDVFHITMRLK